MANITIVKLKVRRGSDSQRKTVVLDQGEVGYTLDTKRLFIGDGAKLGGDVVGNKGLGVFTTEQNLGDVVGAQAGDIGYANSMLFMLTSTPYEFNSTSNKLSGFAYVGPRPEPTTSIVVDANGKLAVKKSSLDSSFMKSTFFGSGLLSATDGAGEVSLNTNYFELSSDGDDPRISPRQNSITEREIKTTALSSGLVGGNDMVIRLNVDNDVFGFDTNNRLVLKNLGTKSLAFSSFDSNVIGDGLVLDGGNQKLEALFQRTNRSLQLTDGTLSISSGVSASDNSPVNQAPELPFVTVDDGIVTGLQSSIYDTATAIGLSGADTGDNVPVGTVLPHARAFSNIPAGYLLCDGKAYDSAFAQYKDLYDVIGSNWNTVYGEDDPGGTMFRVPNLTGGDVLMYGANGTAPGSTTYKLSATTSTASYDLSAQGYNFIIRYSKSVGDFDLFNGAPNQVSKGFLGKYDQKTYDCLDSSGSNLQLSSAGFVLFALSGDTRNPTSDETFDKFAIPVYNW